MLLFGLILAVAIMQALRQPKWEAAFWLTMLLVWAICASSLTYEHRKATWLILSMVVASAALSSQSDQFVSILPRRDAERPMVQHASR
jgi:hypothetical protein